MNNSQTIEITIQLDRTDLSQANVDISLGRLKLHRWIAFAVSTAILSAIVFRLVLTEWTEFQDSRLSLLFGGLFGAAFGPVFLLGVIRVGSFFAANSAIKNTPAMQGPTVWTLTDHGIVIVGPTARGELQWNSFLQVRETRQQFLLYQNKDQANVIPKRCFAGQAEIGRFREMLRSRVSAASLQSGSQ